MFCDVISPLAETPDLVDLNLTASDIELVKDPAEQCHTSWCEVKVADLTQSVSYGDLLKNKHFQVCNTRC